MATATEARKAMPLSPVIVDLGKRKRKDIKELRQGKGPLLDEVRTCVDELVSSGSCAAEAQPVVLIVREKRKRGGMLFPLY